MPSKSKSQQRLMGAAYAAKKNKTPIKELSPELQKILKSMNKKQLKEFAKTKHSKLPEHTKSAATNDLFKSFAKVAMHKLSGCSEKNCGTSAKMNNKNDDKGVKEKKVQEAGKKVKIVESLGGTKPVKTTKKSTALNLKQYKTKKSAADMVAIEQFKPVTAEQLNPFYQPPTDWVNGPGKALDKMVAPFKSPHRAFHDLSTSEKLKDLLSTWYMKNKDVLQQGGISTLAGLGGYGVSKALGGNEWVNAGVGVGTGALTYALQDKRVRNAIAKLLAQVSNKVKA